MLILGSDKARKTLKTLALSGTGQRTVFALLALGQLRRPELADLFEYDLEHGAFDEVKLAAAASLGRLGRADGLDVAIQRLRHSTPRPTPGPDNPQQQASRL